MEHGREGAERASGYFIVAVAGTAYFISVKGGESFWVEKDAELVKYKEGGFAFKDGVIYNAAGREVGSYQHFSDFDYMLIDAGRRAEPGVNVAVGVLAAFGAVVAPIPMAIAGCVAAGADCSATGTAMAAMPTGRFWRALKPFKGRTKTNGLSGAKRRYYQPDRTHGDVEVYDARGRHLGSANPETGAITKPPVSGRRIDVR